MSEAALETLLRRDRVIVGTALAVITVAAWLYLLHLTSAMSDMAMPDMPTMPGMALAMLALHAWSWIEVGLLAVMWTVMMIAMMMPAAAPMILMFSTIHRRRRAEGRPAVPAASAGNSRCDGCCRYRRTAPARREIPSRSCSEEATPKLNLASVVGIGPFSPFT